MSDDGVREVHGTRAKRGDAAKTDDIIQLTEGESVIWIDGNSYSRSMTAEQARYLGLKLLRLSRRVRQRQEG